MVDMVETYYASAEREAGEALRDVAAALRGDAVVQGLLDGYPEIAVLLNDCRQIVACNRSLLVLLGTDNYRDVVGRRVGEVMQCIHATTAPGGCGTAEACRACGAVKAMLDCQRTGEAARGECQLASGEGTGARTFELAVVATPLVVRGMKLMVFAARDIAAQKRREALERIFFHDALNVAGGIHGLASLLHSGERFDPVSHPERLLAMSRQLIEQVQAQRDLAAAERGDLLPCWTTIEVGRLLEDLSAAYSGHPVALGRTLRVVAPPADCALMQSDRTLLQRVLGNLVKNALEASEEGGCVTVSCSAGPGDGVRFHVHNATVMPRGVQLQVFRRSFSTKGGRGRGLGTFSVKLLTSCYLGGEVGFESTEDRGTTFTVTLPRCQVRDWDGGLAAVRPGEGAERLVGCRVLLAEDGLDNRRLLTRLLERAGAKVEVVENGRQAVDAVRRAVAADGAYDVVLMDMQMPELDGYEATRQLRGEGYAGRVIALTAHATTGDREACLDAGCDAHVSKPVSRSVLLDAIVRGMGSGPESRVAGG